MKILLIGPQGSGKSTQGKLLEENLNIPYISTGDIFRKIASQDTKEGKRIKQILDSGQLVDDQTTIELIKKRLKRDNCQNGFILSENTSQFTAGMNARKNLSRYAGYPAACSGEGFILDGYPRTLEQAKNLDLIFDKAFYLKIPKEIVLERLLKRGRADDTQRLIRKRLGLYYLQTQPLLDYYKKQGILVEIDAGVDIKSIQDEIKKFI